ncbi:MAG: AAA family ATPase [Byssovorax sp.]
MIFRIENVGPLREAEVDLGKRLIVLTGPNNTGKTYLAWSVYGLYVSRPKEPSALVERCVGSLLTSTRNVVDLAQLVGQNYQELLSWFARAYTSNIHLCFATERSRFEGSNVILKGIDSAESIKRLTGERYLVGLGRFEQHSGVMALNVLHGASRLVLVDADKQANISTVERLGTLASTELTLLTESLNTSLVNIIHSALFRRCEILPAERIAVNIFAKELALKRSDLVDELVDADLEGQRAVPMDVIRRSTGRYPWPIRDSLRIANDLARLSKKESPFADLATELESAVLGGTIGISSDGELSYVPQSASGQHLGVHLTASVVKSLSSLVFYFRHQARPNDFLIIDEPELNLHPDSQRKLARILAKVVKRGFKLMISTHSDYIIRELNHMIMLSKLSPEAARELGYDPESSLNPDDVGVYLFNEHTAKPVTVTETGFSIQTIDDQINALNADAQRLYARIFDDEAAE